MEAVTTIFPELKETMTIHNSQGEVKVLIKQLADSLPAEQKQLADIDLPTGIDKSVTPFLPEPIYIPAVKDLSDDVKTKEGTPFGKILRILLKAIEPDLAEAQEVFEELNKRLNRIVLPDGKTEDNRLEQVRAIERTIEKYVQESFSNVFVEIDIPPPDIKTVLSSARIYADDGIRSEIDSKGDGLRRAAAFAILRSYVDLNRLDDLTKPPIESARPNEHILLFEEPELYLHPRAQQILFVALGLFSKRHSVLVTTHSPLFFGPDATATFIKLVKRRDLALSTKPFACVHPIDLSDMNAKDQFQLICYENNNAAFFAQTVVLIEGDSDYLVFPHIMRLIRPQKDFTNAGVFFVRIGGKGSIRRYREFFSHFDTRTILIVDLDVLIGGFEQLEPTAHANELQKELLKAVDKAVDMQAASPEPTSKELKNAHGKGDLKVLWRNAREAYSKFETGEAQIDHVLSAINDFFAWERKEQRLQVLKDSSNKEILSLKRNLLSLLRESGTLILEQGDIEAYYPVGITGQDKPSKAQCFCTVVTDRAEALALCASDIPKVDGALGNEFEIMCDAIFNAGNGNQGHV
jgi:hypothetical protein